MSAALEQREPCADAERPARKVLVVVDRFPASGGSRIDAFVRLLPQFGFRPVVVTAAETDSPAARDVQRRHYPADLAVHRASSIGWSYFAERFLERGPDARHFRLLSLLSLPERCLLVPDPMVRWIPLGMRLAAAVARREGIRVALTSSPSESTHLIGRHLRQRHGLRWVADFRDLWTDKALAYRPPTRLHDRWIRRLERDVFAAADHVIANTPENAARYAARFGLTPGRCTVIPNGFDRGDRPPGARHAGAGDVFRIGYVGSLDKHEFPWRLALDAIGRLAQDVGAGHVRLTHCGHLSAQVRDYAAAHGIAGLIDEHGVVPHEQALETIAATDVRLLLLYENPYSDAIVPQKLYHYLVMDGPILAIAPPRGRTAEIVRATRTGVVLGAAAGSGAIHAQLKSYYLAWQRGTLRVAPDPVEVARYDRLLQTRQLAALLGGTDPAGTSAGGTRGE